MISDEIVRFRRILCFAEALLTMLCPRCQSSKIYKKGKYYVQHSRSWIRRYHCAGCLKTFSKKTNSSLYYQKKPFLNHLVFNLLMSGNTQRRAARLLNCSKTTIEHTKLKPVTIPICVSSTYQILGIATGKIKAKGHLSQIALKKYGFREDEGEQATTTLLAKLKINLKHTPLTITTDVPCSGPT